MALWFVGLSVVLVRNVFRDPRIDYRLVAVGALLPDAVDGAFGGARAMHSLPLAVLALAVVMLGTVGQRQRRRRLLALPIGMFMHLVLDGMWARTDVFWWPFTGWAFEDTPLPSFDRPLLLLVVMEVVGLVALVRFAAARTAERPS
jgi:hypothetical protein